MTTEFLGRRQRGRVPRDESQAAFVLEARFRSGWGSLSARAFLDTLKVAGIPFPDELGKAVDDQEARRRGEEVPRQRQSDKTRVDEMALRIMGEIVTAWHGRKWLTGDRSFVTRMIDVLSTKHAIATDRTTLNKYLDQAATAVKSKYPAISKMDEEAKPSGGSTAVTK